MTIDRKELQSLTRRDPLAFGITYVDLLEDRQWEVGNRTWIKELYQAVNPWLIEQYPDGLARKVTYQKPTQIGLSTLGIVRALHFLTNWPVRVGYSLPRQQDVNDFVNTRLDKMIARSDLLSGLLQKPDSTHSKSIGNSYMFMMEASVESRMIPLDALFQDEVDLSDQENLGTMQNRMDASKWKLTYAFSTPTIPNFGINRYFEQSDKRHWFVKCEHCGHYQVMDWTKNLRVDGPVNRPTFVAYVCERCGKELTLDKIQTGEWVPEYPERSSEMLGYQISQMMTHPAPTLYASYIDPQTTLKEFYRKRLGIPYAVEGGSISRDDFLVNCFEDPFDREGFSDGESRYFLGADQGNEIQVVVGKLAKDEKYPRVTHIELIPPSEGFGRIGQLMRLFKVKLAVIDGDPNRHPVRDLQKDFPGRILIADYSEIDARFQTKKAPKSKVRTNVVINRTEGFDYITEGIRKGHFHIYGDPGNLPPLVETLIDHVTSLRRDTEERRQPSGTVEVGVWRALRADHLAHALLYMQTAIDADQGSGFRVAVRHNKEEDQVVEDGTPGKEAIIGIISLLAEVPSAQLDEWRKQRENPEYSMPFPLSVKMSQTVTLYETDDILWVVDFFLRSNYQM